MKILYSPLTIAASELLTAVDYSFSGTLMIYKKSRWKSCYCIVSQGCLYLYDDWLSRKAFQKQSLKEFERVWESAEEHNGKNCFYLGYNDKNLPLHFCCDTEKTQKKWVDDLNRSILEVKTHVRPPCDSGYGGAETEPAIEVGMKEEAVVVHMKAQQHALDSTDTDDDFEVVQVRGLSAERRHNSEASSFCSVSESSDPHCDMRNLHLAHEHENDSEIKPADTDKSESKTDQERHNGASSFCFASESSDPHCDMRNLHLAHKHENDSEIKPADSDKSESKTDQERHNARGLSAECRHNSDASSFCSVSESSDPHCDMKGLHLAHEHENDREIKAADSAKSESSKTDPERYKETVARQNRAIPHLKNVIDELKTKVQSDNKGLSGGGHKKDMQPT